MSTTLHIAARGPLDTQSSPTVMHLPCDVGDVNDPGNSWQCWAVMRSSRSVSALKFAQPRQCMSRRQGAKRKGEKMPHCCRQHSKWNEAAIELEAKAKGKK